MIHQVLMFLALDNAATQGLTQATLRTPPAYPSPGPVAAPLQLKSVKFIASVLGNAAGFASFIAGCWLCLQLMEAFL